MMAVKLLTPNMPRLDTVNVPPCWSREAKASQSSFSRSCFGLESKANLKFVRLKLVCAGLLRQTVDVEADAGQSLLVGVEDDGRDETVVSGNSDVDVDIVEPVEQFRPHFTAQA